ncbi:MAG: tetratricopeptide repeat protein [Syntrophothermus sp.]
MSNKLLSTLIAVLLAACIVPAFPQSEKSSSDIVITGKQMITAAYTNYSIDKMLAARNYFEQFTKDSSYDPALLYYLTYADYKLLEMSLRQEGKDAFSLYYENAAARAGKLAENKEWSSEARVLQSAIYMMKIASSPMTAVALSPKINGLLQEAEKADPENPRTYIIRGTMAFNTPAMFGGSKSEAAENFRKAVKIFDRQDTSFTVRPSWGYAESLAWLGRSLEEEGNYDAAKFTYLKALSIDPNYAWVKYVLMPGLEKKMTSK